MSVLGDKIRRCRKQKGLTLEQLAKATGSSKTYMWELENRDLRRPSARILSSIAEVLGVSLEYLLDEKDQITLTDALDAQFFRTYKGLDVTTKNRIRQLVDVWNDVETEETPER